MDPFKTNYTQTTFNTKGNGMICDRNLTEKGDKMTESGRK